MTLITGMKEIKVKRFHNGYQVKVNLKKILYLLHIYAKLNIWFIMIAMIIIIQ